MRFTSIAALAIASAVSVEASTPTSGTLVAAQLRCQGYLCPQWALDLTRWDYVRNIQEQYTWQLSELLPLAPTAQRSFEAFTAYNNEDRTYTVAAQSYPAPGLDSFWTLTISDDVTTSTPLLSNIIIAHPDTDVSEPGHTSLVRILTNRDGTLFAIFTDGSISEVDIKGQVHNVVGNIFSASSNNGVGMTLTWAHTLSDDGTTLYSFVQDLQYNNYVITTDLSSTPLKVSPMVLVQPIKGELGKETPINAMFTQQTATSNSTLTIVTAGNFDSISYIDNESGAQTPVYANLADGPTSPAQLYCNTDTKDCDYWVTSTYDWVDQRMYFQGHTISGGDDVSSTTMIYQVEWMPGSKRNPTLYPVMDAVANAPVFGFSGYQYIPFAN